MPPELAQIGVPIGIGIAVAGVALILVWAGYGWGKVAGKLEVVEKQEGKEHAAMDVLAGDAPTGSDALDRM